MTLAFSIRWRIFLLCSHWSFNEHPRYVSCSTLSSARFPTNILVFTFLLFVITRYLIMLVFTLIHFFFRWSSRQLTCFRILSERFPSSRCLQEVRIYSMEGFAEVFACCWCVLLVFYIFSHGWLQGTVSKVAHKTNCAVVFTSSGFRIWQNNNCWFHSVIRYNTHLLIYVVKYFYQFFQTFAFKLF